MPLSHNISYRDVSRKFTYVMHAKFTHNIVLGRKLEVLLLLKPGKDSSVTAGKVSNTS